MTITEETNNRTAAFAARESIDETLQQQRAIREAMGNHLDLDEARELRPAMQANDLTLRDVVEESSAAEEVADGWSDALSLQTETVARLVWCTGGPHYELRWTVGNPEGATFVSLPWFDRVELPATEEMCDVAAYHDEILSTYGEYYR